MSYAYASGPYRSRRRMFFGVCRGLADYLNFSVFWTRMLVLIAFIFTGFFPVGAVYLLLALLMKTEPYGSAAFCMREERDWHAPRHARPHGGLDDRIVRMEASARAQQYDWDERLQRG